MKTAQIRHFLWFHLHFWFFFFPSPDLPEVLLRAGHLRLLRRAVALNLRRLGGFGRGHDGRDGGLRLKAGGAGGEHVVMIRNNNNNNNKKNKKNKFKKDNKDNKDNRDDKDKKDQEQEDEDEIYIYTLLLLLWWYIYMYKSDIEWWQWC